MHNPRSQYVQTVCGGKHGEIGMSQSAQTGKKRPCGMPLARGTHSRPIQPPIPLRRDAQSPQSGGDAAATSAAKAAASRWAPQLCRPEARAPPPLALLPFDSPSRPFNAAITAPPQLRRPSRGDPDRQAAHSKRVLPPRVSAKPRLHPPLSLHRSRLGPCPALASSVSTLARTCL